MSYLIYLWAGASIYLILHYLFFHSRLIFHKDKNRKPFRDGVSVIICARNEAENLSKNLPSVLDQDFRKYEVIVVNDRSTDNTAEVLRELKKKSRKLKVVEIKEDEEENQPGKKKAVLAGIFKARNRFLVHTDADCEPASNNWLKSMASHFRTKEVILGFGPYRNGPGLTGMITQWETLLTAQQYFSLAKAGLPYMGVGRNLGYTKGLFFNSDQFRKHQQLASGDDDLFIGQKATGLNTVIELQEDTFTWSDPPPNFGSWWKQKRRHLTTGRYYKFLPAFLLGLFGLAQLLFYLLLIPVFSLGLTGSIFWTLFALKFAMQIGVLVPTAVKLKQQRVLWLFPILELITVVFLTMIHFLNVVNPKKKAWN